MEESWLDNNWWVILIVAVQFIGMVILGHSDYSNYHSRSAGAFQLSMLAGIFSTVSWQWFDIAKLGIWFLVAAVVFAASAYGLVAMFRRKAGVSVKLR